MMKYYAVPPYKGNETFKGDPHIVNENGELVAVFEADMDTCEKFVEAINGRCLDGKSIVRFLKDYDMSYKEKCAVYQWLEDYFQKSHEASMEPEKHRFKTPVT